MLTENQRHQINDLINHFDEGTQYVLVLDENNCMRYFRIDSIETLNYVCWKIFKERQSRFWYEECEPKIPDGLHAYFFLLNRSQDGYEREHMSLEEFEEI